MKHIPALPPAPPTPTTTIFGANADRSVTSCCCESHRGCVDDTAGGFISCGSDAGTVSAEAATTDSGASSPPLRDFLNPYSIKQPISTNNSCQPHAQKIKRSCRRHSLRPTMRSAAAAASVASVENARRCCVTPAKVLVAGAALNSRAAAARTGRSTMFPNHSRVWRFRN